MTALKNKIITFLLGSALILNGCGRTETPVLPSSPQQAVEYTMESIRDLDMAALNNCTDNFIQTYHNWIGVPIENEYRSFNELLQPRSKNSSRYKTSYKLDQKMMEKLTWEITAVRDSGSTAEVDLMITNIDMQKVMEQYELQLIGNMLEDPGSGIVQMIKDTVTVKDTLISLIDALGDNDIVTTAVTVCAYQEQGHWKVHMDTDFINAFSGNLYDDSGSEEILKMEELLDSRIDEWAEDFENRAEKWMEQWAKP